MTGISPAGRLAKADMKRDRNYYLRGIGEQCYSFVIVYVLCAGFGCMPESEVICNFSTKPTRGHESIRHPREPRRSVPHRESVLHI